VRGCEGARVRGCEGGDGRSNAVAPRQARPPFLCRSAAGHARRGHPSPSSSLPEARPSGPRLHADDGRAVGSSRGTSEAWARQRRDCRGCNGFGPRTSIGSGRGGCGPGLCRRCRARASLLPGVDSTGLRATADGRVQRCRSWNDCSTATDHPDPVRSAAVRPSSEARPSDPRPALTHAVISGRWSPRPAVEPSAEIRIEIFLKRHPSVLALLNPRPRLRRSKQDTRARLQASQTASSGGSAR
jgi:hypothetical protein